MLAKVFQKSYKGKPVEANILLFGKDIQVCLTGGDQAHIGAVAIGIPRKSLSSDGMVSSSASVICVTGHKEDILARRISFVVGDTVSPSISTKKTQEDYGEVYAYTYKQLVQTAGKRLFNLKDKLTVRYQELNAKDYLAEILGEPRQMNLSIVE